ncbi:MAG TPA: hypothetical protein VEY92_12095 [Pseudoxanthomonas sp.]|nr:hypothetical protein [Pseudoxanthomonas sp.]
MTQSTFTKQQLSERIESLLSRQDSIIVEAAKLTDLTFETVCFERDDSLLLKFKASGAEDVLALPYEEFFVDEGHVAGSLENACLSPGDRLLIKRKYPGYAGPIEFQKVPQGG